MGVYENIFFPLLDRGVLLKIEWWQVYGWIVPDVDRYSQPHMGENRRRWKRKWVWDTNICVHLCHPCTNFKCLSIIHIINMLSIIVHHYFCAQATHKPVITWSLWEQEFLHRLHYKMMSENLDMFRKCLNRLNLPQGVIDSESGCNIADKYWKMKKCLCF